MSGTSIAWRAGAMNIAGARRIHWRFAVLGFSYMGLCYASLLMQSDIQLVVRYFLGLDFKEFYDAAHVYLTGGNPYEVARFVTPPASLLPNLLLSPFDFYTARDLWCLAGAIMLGTGGVLAARAAGHRGTDVFLTVAFLFATFPAQMLIERGNIDALIFLLLALALAARPAWLAAVAWTLAALIKIYPALLGPYLWRSRGHRSLLVSIAVVALVCAAFWRETLAYGPHLLMRATEERFDQNLSPVAYFGHGFHIYALAYVALNLWLDRRLLSQETTTEVRRFLGGAWIVPMLFFPRVVLSYVGVVLVLAFVALDPLEQRLRRWQRLGLALLEGLVMMPTTGFAFVTGELEWYAIPQVALFLYSLALIALKLKLLRESRASARASTRERQLQGADAMSDDHRGNQLPLVHPCAGG
jgi:Glycosyltransferase family 87